jgi:hypothetical protein
MPDASAVDLFVNCCSLITKAFSPNRIDVVSQNGTFAVASNPNAKKNVSRQIISPAAMHPVHLLMPFISRRSSPTHVWVTPRTISRVLNKDRCSQSPAVCWPKSACPSCCSPGSCCYLCRACCLAFRQSTGKAETLRAKLVRGEITAPIDIEQDVVFATAVQALPTTVKPRDLETIRTILLGCLDRAQGAGPRSSNRRGTIYRAAWTNCCIRKGSSEGFPSVDSIVSK